MIEKILYQLCDTLSKSFYRKNVFLCKSVGYELDDIKQEAKFYAWKVLYKFPNIELEDKKKLVNTAVSWRLKALKRYILEPKMKEVFDTIHKRKNNNEEDNNFEIIVHKKKEPSTENKEYSTDMLLKDCQNICSAREYHILYERLINKTQFYKIGKEMNITAMGAHYIFNKVIKKLSHMFTK